MMPFFILNSFWRCIWISPFSWFCKPTTVLQSRTDSSFSNGTSHLVCLQLYQQERKNCHHLKELWQKHSHLVQVCIRVQETAVKKTVLAQCDMATICYSMSGQQRTASGDLYAGNLTAAVATLQQESWSCEHTFAVKYMQTVQRLFRTSGVNSVLYILICSYLALPIYFHMVLKRSILTAEMLIFVMEKFLKISLDWRLKKCLENKRIQCHSTIWSVPHIPSMY